MAYSRCLIMRNKPRIRFKGFTEDWEQRKVNDLFKITRGQVLATSLTTPEKTSENIYPVYSSQTKNNGLMGYYSEYLFEDAITWTTDGANAGTVNFRPGRFYSTNVNGVLINENGYACYAVSEIINKVAYKYVSKVGNPKLMNNVMADIDIIITSDIAELGRISALIEAYNQYITLHQRKLEKLKLTKKALLQKLFPKNGSQFPEIRFKGFTDAWEQREFSDIFAEVKSGLSRMLSNDDIGLPVVRANNINDGQLNLVDDIKYWYKNDPQGANTNNYLIEQGDILINFINSEAKMGTAAYVTRRPERDTIYTTNILRCKVNDEYNPYFVYSLTFLNSYKNYIASITKPAVNQASFTTVDFKKYSIKIPTVKEQNQIADLIETFNKLITLHQRKLDKLQDVKKGLLQKMFI